MTDRRQYHNQYNSQNPVLSVRTKNKDRFFDLAKKLDVTAEQLFNSLFETFQKNYVPVSNRVTIAKGQTGNFERLRQQIGDYLAAGNSIESILDLLEQFEAGETQRENQKIVEGKMAKNKQGVEAQRNEVLEICRKAMQNPILDVREARQAAELFVMAGGDVAELAKLAKGENPQPGEAVAKAEVKTPDPGEKARKIKEEMLNQSELQQHAHLFKSRGWLPKE